MSTDTRPSRSRPSGIGPLGMLSAFAVAALLLGSLTAWQAGAAPGPSESTFVPVTPARILDTRDPIDLGLAGPFVSPVSQKLQVTGNVATTEGNRVVVPAGASGVVLNVTVASPTAAGFVSIRPGDATGAPATSSLNFEAGVVQPNAVTVALPTSGPNAGRIDITYDAYGAVGPTTDLLIDVVGYTTNTGLQSLVADLATKANAADVYTKAEVDAAIADGPVVEAFGTALPDPFPTPQSGSVTTSFTTSRTSRLHVTVSVSLSLACLSTDVRYVWLELDGEPLTSSLIVAGDLDFDGGSIFPAMVLFGVTDGPVAAGSHDLVVRQACAFGDAGAGSWLDGARGLVTYIADDPGASLASSATELSPADGCAPPAVEIEPGVCVIEP